MWRISASSHSRRYHYWLGKQTSECRPCMVTLMPQLQQMQRRSVALLCTSDQCRHSKLGDMSGGYAGCLLPLVCMASLQATTERLSSTSMSSVYLTQHAEPAA